MELFIDAHQYSKISQAQADASAAKQAARDSVQRMADLERRVDRLALACQALWEVLKESTHIPESAVYARMEQIDLRDGKADGKISGEILQCSKCGRTINSKHPVCVYCGYRSRGTTICN